jgi:hypothetical protein
MLTREKLLQEFLLDDLVTEKYKISKAQAAAFKETDRNAAFFVEVLKECLQQHEKGPSRAASNLYNFVFSKIKEKDLPD